MKTNIQKLGNSFGVIIPKSISSELNLHYGSLVDIQVDNGRILIYPHKPKLADFINEINDENKHHLLFENYDIR